MMLFCPRCLQGNAEPGETCKHCQAPLLLHGRYQLQERLGKGGSSHVFRALDVQEKQERAIKILQNASDWKGVEHFERQLSILQSLSHPGIPKIYEHFTEGNDNGKLSFYSVQELIRGESLADSIKRGHRYTQEDATKLWGQLVEILAYLHSLSPPVLHRDIKPQNVMLRKADGAPVLIDFDTARGVAIDKERADGTMVGTAGFVPMEQLSGQAQPASDIYSLGMTMVAALSQKEIFEIPVERMRVKFEPYLNVSRGLQKILRKMTEPAIEDRYQSIKDLQSALANLSNQRATINSAAPAPRERQERPSQQPKQQPRQLQSAGGGWLGWILLTSALVGVIGYCSQTNEPQETTDPLVLPEATGESNAKFVSYQPTIENFIEEGVVWADVLNGFSSQWGDSSWSATQVLGAPNVFPKSGTNGYSWAPKETNSGFEWVIVAFPASVKTKAITVLETSYVGGIVRLDDMSAGEPQVIWKGTAAPDDIYKSRAFRVELSNPRVISSVRVILDTRINNDAASWEEIDAIGLIPATPPTPAQLATLKSAQPTKPAPPKPTIIANGAQILTELSSRGVIWANSAVASSQYKNDSWSATQSTGAPNAFPVCGDSANAWAPQEQDAGTETLALSFAEMEAVGIVIVENDKPGSITKIEEVSGEKPVPLWGNDPSRPAEPCRILEISFKRQKIKSIRLTLNTTNQLGWEEIDAVGLIPAKK